MTSVSWELKGMEYGNCNCDYGCPCQFNALPTYGNCQYLLFARVDRGIYNDINLDGVVDTIDLNDSDSSSNNNTTK